MTPSRPFRVLLRVTEPIVPRRWFGPHLRQTLLDPQALSPGTIHPMVEVHNPISESTWHAVSDYVRSQRGYPQVLSHRGYLKRFP